MSFGANYTPVYTAPQLEDGIYNAMIESAGIDKYGERETCKVVVKVAGKPGYNPNTIWLNDTPKIGEVKANGNPITQEDIDRANRQLTTFFKCFGIQEGNFNFAQWKGKTGTIKVAPQYDKNEADKKSKIYKQIIPQLPKESDTATQPPVVTTGTAKAEEGHAEIPPDDFAIY